MNFANTMGNPYLGYAPEYGEALRTQLGLQQQGTAAAQRQQLLDNVSRFGGMASGSLQSGLAGIGRQNANALYQGQQNIALQGAQAQREDRQAKEQRDWQAQQNELQRNLQEKLAEEQLNFAQFQYGNAREDAKGANYRAFFMPLLGATATATGNYLSSTK